MARPLRIEMEHGIYHVTSRGWEKRVLVDSERDRADWLRMLGEVAIRYGWRVFSWVLMTNHFHLFLRTPDPNLSAGMHALLPDSAAHDRVSRCRRKPVWGSVRRRHLQNRETS